MQRQTIAQYMSGLSKPDTDRLTVLCKALDVSADYLLGFLGEENSTKDENLRIVSEYTKLSNDAISVIAHYSRWKSLILSEMIINEKSDDIFDNYHYVFDISSIVRRLTDGLKRVMNGEPIPEDLDISHFYDEFIQVDDGNYDDSEIAAATLQTWYERLRLYYFELNDSFSDFIESLAQTRESLNGAKKLIAEWKEQKYHFSLYRNLDRGVQNGKH